MALSPEEQKLKSEREKLKAEGGNGVYARLLIGYFPFLGPWFVAKEVGTLPECINLDDVAHSGYFECRKGCHIIRYNKGMFVRWIAVHKRKK